MSSSSNQRHLGRYQIDRISDLPDAILSHILSFVPSKTAVKTCILSKRWKYVWTQVPALDFSEMPNTETYESLTSQQKILFKNFVLHVLHHNEVPCVQRICFNPLPADEFMDILSCISAVARRRYHKIEISVGAIQIGYCLLLPMGTISCEELVVLELNGPIHINVPMSLNLPNLEIVHLSDMRFSSDDTVNVKRLLSGCPVLKELLLEKFDGIDTLHVESLTLRKLQIRRISLREGVIIKTPQLRCLDIIYIHSEDYDVCDLSFIAKANLNFFLNKEKGHKLIKAVSGVRTLRLGRMSQQLFGYESKLPVFRNLTCLELEVEANADKILKCAPKLKYLIFECVNQYYSFDFSSAPKCLPCLESVELRCFSATEKEMRYVAYFLKMAPALKEMKVNIRVSEMDRECERAIYQKLLKLPRASGICEVEVVLRDF